MNVNDDFSKRAAVHGAAIDWIPSPMPGVERKPLDRIGDEVARATTIVRYAPGSAFSAHTHTGGEEFLVLEGVFQDQYGDFPAGTYVRNPPTTSHEPASEGGCVILVKLWQFDADDRNQFSVDINSLSLEPGENGVARGLLHQDSHETVAVEQWEASTTQRIGDSGGAEILLLDGSFEYDGLKFERHDWLRLPQGTDIDLTAGPDGVRIWIKTGHLAHVRVPDPS